MASIRTSRSFRDISLSFTPHPITRDLTILTNESAISRSVRNLVETIPTERFYNSSIGSDIRSSLFNNADYGTAAEIQQQIETTISNNEPRIENLIVEVYPYPDNNLYEVNVIFDIIGQEFPTQKVNFILEATR